MARSLAILIDGENIPARLLLPLRQKVATLGTPTLWQVFGDFISWPHPEWQDAARNKGIEIRHVGALVGPGGRPAFEFVTHIDNDVHSAPGAFLPALS